MPLQFAGGYTARTDRGETAFQQQSRRQQQVQDIIGQMQAAQNKANQANEQRYQQILGQYANLGQAGRARIEEQTTRRQAAATQNLVSRGLGNTTITSAVERGIGRDAEISRQELDERVAVQKAGVMERRTDTGPDLGMFANLLQQAGQQQAPARATITRMGANAQAGLTGTGSLGIIGRHRAAQARGQELQLARARGGR